MKSKIISILLVVCLAVSFAACSGGTNLEVDNLLTVGEHQISFEEYRMNFFGSYYQLVSGGATIGDDAESLNTLKEYTLESLKISYSVLDIAKEKGIELTEEEIALVNEQVEATKESLGEDEFIAQLAAGFSSEELYRTSSINAALQNKLFFDIHRDGLIEFVNEDFIRAGHILIQFNDSGEEPTQDEKDAAKATAEEVVEKLNAGEDFDELVTEYNQDPGMTASLREDGVHDGYYFSEQSSFVEEFKEAAFALKEGEASGLVETDFGYHIIKRLPLEDDYIETFVETQDVIYASAQYQEFIEMLSEASEDMETVFSEEYYLVDISIIQQ